MNHYENYFDEEDSKYYEDYFDEIEFDNSMNLTYQMKTECQSSYKKLITKQTKDMPNTTHHHKEITMMDQGMKVCDKKYCQITETKQIPKESGNKEIYNKNKQVLRGNEVEFKEDFYSIFLHNIKGKKIIPKDKVIAIHNSICEEAGVRRMTRNEYRVINNYFQHFAKFRFQIIQSIIRNKEELSRLIDLPSIIQRANEISESRNKKRIEQISTNNDK